MVRRSVLLPAPLGPRMAMRSPDWMVRLTGGRIARLYPISTPRNCIRSMVVLGKNPGRVLSISRDEHRWAKPTGAHAFLGKNPGRVLSISRDEHRWAKPTGAHAFSSSFHRRQRIEDGVDQLHVRANALSLIHISE